MGSKRISADVWETVELAVMLCLDEDTEVTSHNVAAWAEEHDKPEVTQSRAFKKLEQMYEDGLLVRRITNGPTEYVYSWDKDLIR